MRIDSPTRISESRSCTRLHHLVRLLTYDDIGSFVCRDRGPLILLPTLNSLPASSGRFVWSDFSILVTNSGTPSLLFNASIPISIATRNASPVRPSRICEPYSHLFLSAATVDFGVSSVASSSRVLKLSYFARTRNFHSVNVCELPSYIGTPRRFSAGVGATPD